MEQTLLCIRPFAPEDLSAAEAVLHGAWTETESAARTQLGDELYEYFLAGYAEKCGAELASALSSSARTGASFSVTDAAGTIAALGSWTPSGALGRIGRFAVREDLRGHGIGTALIKELLGSMRTRGMKYVQLDIGDDTAHAAARRVLEKCGLGHPVPHVTYYRKNTSPAVIVPPDGFSIRRPTAEECLRFAEIAVEAWQPIWAASRRMQGDELFAAMGDVAKSKYDATLKLLTDPAAFGYGLFCGNEPAGFCAWRIAAVPGGKCGVVSLNGISDAYKGRGLGHLMQNFVTRDMLSNGISYAKVLTGGDEGHAPARRTYEKAGFDRSLRSLTLRAIL